MKIKDKNFIDLKSKIENDDVVFAVQLPSASKYAGKWLVWSWTTSGMLDSSRAVIVNDLDTSELINCDPFCTLEELREEGFDVLDVCFESDGDGQAEPAVFKIAENETFIDFWDYDFDLDEEGEASATGLYIGNDANAFIAKYFYIDE